MNQIKLRMPETVVLDESTKSETYGKFTLQPLERGYGATLGNSLRRVLLSSLPGTAIIGIKISDVLHEFTTIPGVVEDVTEIILNLKQVRLKALTKKLGRIEISFNGEGEFVAGDLAKYTNEVEVLNPDLHIATLNSVAKFNLELILGQGRGYVPANDIKTNEAKFVEFGIGVIAIDAIFTPLKNVRYDIENVRIGDRNDFEKLTIEVQTDGSISPQDAMTQSAKILKEHLDLFTGLNLEPESPKEGAEKDPEVEKIKKALLMSIDELELSVRAHNCLKAASIRSVGDLVRREESELLKYRNFGRKSLAELSEHIEKLGLHFGMDIEKYLKSEGDNN